MTPSTTAILERSTTVKSMVRTAQVPLGTGELAWTTLGTAVVAGVDVGDERPVVVDGVVDEELFGVALAAANPMARPVAASITTPKRARRLRRR
jgi:hypothetical protein